MLQKYAAKFLTDLFGLGEGDIESRPMGSSGIDLMFSPLARKLYPFSIESKNTKAFPSLAALEQSKYNAKDKTIPAVIWKPPGKGMDKSIIYFNFEEFSKFWKEEFGDVKEIKCQPDQE